MFKICNVGGKSLVVLFCASCNRPIDDAQMGAVVYPRSNVEGSQLQPSFVHKGDCHNRTEAAMEPGGRPPWMELRHFMAYAIQNLGLVGPVLERAISSGDAAALIGSDTLREGYDRTE